MSSTTEHTVGHTPGPWRVTEYTDPKLADRRMIHGPGDNWFLADVYGAGGSYNVDANARLIAAAPEMLEALREIAEISRGLRFATGLKIGELARAAIAKATAIWYEEN